MEETLNVIIFSEVMARFVNASAPGLSCGTSKVLEHDLHGQHIPLGSPNSLRFLLIIKNMYEEPGKI